MLEESHSAHHNQLNDSDAVAMKSALQKRARLAYLLSSFPFKDPLKATNLSHFTRYMRVRLMINGATDCSLDCFQPYGVGVASLNHMENISPERWAGTSSPLNLGYLFAVPQIAEHFFRERKGVQELDGILKKRFWELAYDYACATETAWNTGAILAQNCQKRFGVPPEGIPQRITDMKAQIADQLQRYGVYSIPWQPETSAYRPYMGDLNAVRGSRASRKKILPTTPDTHGDPFQLPRARVISSHVVDSVYSNAAGDRWGKAIPEDHKATLAMARSRAFGHKALKKMDADPLSIEAMGMFTKYMRHYLAAEGIVGWGQGGKRWGNLSRSLESIENIQANDRPSRLSSPLNLRYLFSLPALGKEMFKADVLSEELAPKLEAKFWELAWDYANATEQAWRHGAFHGVKCREQLGYDKYEVPKRIITIKTLIRKHLANFEVAVEPWNAEMSAYRPFMGSLSKPKRKDRRLVDETVKVPESFDDAEFFSDYLWHAISRYSNYQHFCDTIGIDKPALHAFFGRYTGQANGATDVAEVAGYNPTIIAKLPEVMGYLKRVVPESELTPYQEARFWCMAEDYAYTAFDYSYDGGKGIPYVEKFRNTMTMATEEVIPKAMREVTKSFPLHAARAGLALCNERLQNMAISEIRVRQQEGQLTAAEMAESANLFAPNVGASRA